MPAASRRLPLLMLAGAACAPLAAAAQSSCRAPSPDCVVVGDWNISVSLGAGARSNPVRRQSDIPLVVLPQISYYGRRFFLENLELGFTLHENETHNLSLIAAPGYDRVFFVKSDLQNLFVVGTTFVSLAPVEDASSDIVAFPVHRRRTTYLAGPEWTFSYERLIGQVNALYEVTGEHQGFEVRAALATPIIQGRGTLIASGGFTWKSAEVVRYYYGVERLYEPGSALNPFLKLGYSRPLSERWTFTAFAHYEHLAGAIADSPIVSGGGVATAFAGFSYKII